MNIPAGYRITVTSWENDGDHYNTVSLDGLSLDKVGFYADLCKAFRSRNSYDGKPGGVGNYYEPSDAEIAHVHGVLRKIYAKHPAIRAELVDEDTETTDEEFEDGLGDMLMDMASDIGLTAGEFFTRVCSAWTVEYLAVPVEFEDVTSRFK